MKAARGSNQGFTLLEILLVLILITGAGFVLLIKLPVQFDKEHLALATTQLLGDLRDVRQAALAENTWYAVKFYPQAGKPHYQIFRQGTKVKDVYLNEGVKFVDRPGDLTINASGRSGGMTITLQNSAGEQRSIVVAPVGMRIREK